MKQSKLNVGTVVFIYINFLATIGYGIGIGFLIAVCARIGKLRSTLLSGLAGIIFGVFALYASWAAWAGALISRYAEKGTPHAGFLDVLVSPDVIARIGEAVGQEGYEIRSLTIKGLVLFGFWAIEAIIIVGASAYLAGSVIKDMPFCERCHLWLDDKESVSKFQPIQDERDFRYQLELGNYSILSQLKKLDPLSSTFTEFELRQCKKCSELRVLSLKSVMVSTDKDGKEQRTEKAIVDKLLVNAEVFNLIKELRSQMPFRPGAA